MNLLSLNPLSFCCLYIECCCVTDLDGNKYQWDVLLVPLGLTPNQYVIERVHDSVIVLCSPAATDIEQLCQGVHSHSKALATSCFLCIISSCLPQSLARRLQICLDVTPLQICQLLSLCGMNLKRESQRGSQSTLLLDQCSSGGSLRAQEQGPGACGPSTCPCCRTCASACPYPESNFPSARSLLSPGGSFLLVPTRHRA
jgi:hypothetical protein